MEIPGESFGVTNTPQFNDPDHQCPGFQSRLRHRSRRRRGLQLGAKIAF